ncbi:unnamed protein product, partial [Oppiella nova]
IIAESDEMVISSTVSVNDTIDASAEDTAIDYLNIGFYDYYKTNALTGYLSHKTHAFKVDNLWVNVIVFRAEDYEAFKTLLVLLNSHRVQCNEVMDQMDWHLLSQQMRDNNHMKYTPKMCTGIDKLSELKNRRYSEPTV